MNETRIFLLGTALAGGIGRNIVNLSEAFAAKGLDVHVLLESMDGPLMSDLTSRATVYPMATTHPVAGVLPLAWRLFRLGPGSVLAPNHRLALVALRARLLLPTSRRPRVFANVHNTYSQKYLRLSRPKRERRTEKLRRHYPGLDGIICVSAGVRADLASVTGIPEDRMTVIYNPVVTDRLLLQAREPVDHPWFGAGQPPVILSVGRLVASKDFAGLMAAFEIVRATAPCRLVIVGDGPLRRDLEDRRQASRFADEVALIGNDNNPFRYMRRAGLFVLSSRYEGFGNVLVEALACGAPVVSTDCPHGPREILLDGRLGPLVPAGDIEALARAMATTLARKPPEPLLRESLARFQASTVADEYLRAFSVRRRP